MTTYRTIYNIVIWDDKKGEKIDMKEDLRTIAAALKNYGITKIEIVQTFDIDKPSQKETPEIAE